MAWEEISVSKIIENKRNTDSEFNEVWEQSRSEYQMIADMIRIRKEKGLTQTQLAEMTGNKQQVISRIENKENSPSLTTFSSIVRALGYELSLKPISE